MQEYDILLGCTDSREGDALDVAVERGILAAVIPCGDNLTVGGNVVVHAKRVFASRQHRRFGYAVKVFIDSPEVARGACRFQVELLVEYFFAISIGQCPNHEHLVHRAGVVEGNFIGTLLGDINLELGNRARTGIVQTGAVLVTVGHVVQVAAFRLRRINGREVYVERVTVATTDGREGDVFQVGGEILVVGTLMEGQFQRVVALGQYVGIRQRGVMALGFECPVPTVLARTYYISGLAVNSLAVSVGDEEVDSYRFTRRSRVEADGVCRSLSVGNGK